MSGSNLTRADDCERMIRILADGPSEGLTMDDIQGITVRAGEAWSLRTINAVLCDLGRQIASEKGRVKGRAAIRYFLRRSNP